MTRVLLEIKISLKAAKAITIVKEICRQIMKKWLKDKKLIMIAFVKLIIKIVIFHNKKVQKF